MTGLGATSTEGGDEQGCQSGSRRSRDAGAHGQRPDSAVYISATPPLPAQVWVSAVLGLCCFPVDPCLAALVTASLLPSGLRSTEEPLGFPLSKKSSPPPTEEGVGGRQVSLLCRPRGCKQGLLSELPSGIYIPVGSSVGRVRLSEEEMRRHYLLRGP